MNPLRSVGAKVSILTCLLVLAVIGLMARQLFFQVEEGLVAEMKIRSESFARAAREALVPKPDLFALHFAVEEVRQQKAVTYAAVLDADGRVLSHSDPKLIGEKLDDPISRRAREARQVLLQVGRAGDAERWHLSAPIMVGAAFAGLVRLGFDQSSLDEALRQPKRDILVIAAVALAAGLGGTVLIVGWIMRPLPRLAAAAREAGRGNFSVQVDVRGSDEIGVLAKTFNDMTRANSLLFKTIRAEKQKLETIFHETREGLMWVSPQGRVLLLNPAARALLGAQERAVTDLPALLKAFACQPPLPELLAGEARTRPFELTRSEPKPLILAGVVDRLSATGTPGGLLLVFHDATIEKRGETLSRNFLSLVSHKLRTPLTVALGFVELIQSDQSNLTDFQKKALAKVKGEDEKLRSLVEKLIAFSSAVHPDAIVLEKGVVSLKEAVEGALKNLSGLFKERGATVHWDAASAETLPALSADPFLLREAVANLVENAVKFNRAEKPSVWLAAAAAEDCVELTVRDDGPGIPSEEQPRLFRKFYQIDDDFTGQVPGWGLGLAFVKNVAEAHGGTVSLAPGVGRGATFRLRLPRPPAAAPAPADPSPA